MTEWHLPPDYIVKNWTEELLDLMVEKLVARKGRESESEPPPDPGTSEEMFLAKAGNLVKKVVKK